ncbi:hypothetical protein, partial [Micrococcus terreus]|uniref:hypothetical protein n=1 Tax=Micrococcus terreus TaxID=574650 RepID=UPI0023F7648F
PVVRPARRGEILERHSPDRSVLNPGMKIDDGEDRLEGVDIAQHLQRALQARVGQQSVVG